MHSINKQTINQEEEEIFDIVFTLEAPMWENPANLDSLFSFKKLIIENIFLRI